MAKTAEALLVQARKWLGLKEAGGGHQEILDTYNAIKPLPRGYKMTKTDAWCACFVSACAAKTGMTDIIPPECSCNKMIALFRELGEWRENENVTPEPGWIIFYDWQDTGSGDNQGSADHVGIVEKVESGTITVIEGNYSDMVKRRTIKVNGRYIRGYGIPRFEKDDKPVENPATYTVVKGDYPEKIAAKFGITWQALIAANISKYPKITRDYIQIGWVLAIPGKAEAKPSFSPYTVKVTARSGLNVRKEPNTACEIYGALKYGETVTILGHSADGKWGMITYKAKTGWVCLQYTK